MPSHVSGKALTVLGAVDGGALGITLPHEHLPVSYTHLTLPTIYSV